MWVPDQELRVLRGGVLHAVMWTAHIGFTGTQQGMTPEQASSLQAFLASRPHNFIGHHGLCVGADEQFDGIARAALNFEWMELHPCNLAHMQFRPPQAPRDVWHPMLGPLQRNEVIVKMCDLLIATPKEAAMQLRSGTWTTVRYAVKAGKPVHVILPNGAIVPWA